MAGTPYHRIPGRAKPGPDAQPDGPAGSPSLSSIGAPVAYGYIGHQDMAHTRDDVLALVRATFPDARWQGVLDLLDTYGVESFERERERVQLAVVRLSEGSEPRLREFLAVAKRDYRDVLFWAEYPEDARIDTPEKRQAVRELFKKLGIDPPAGLLE